MTEINSLLLICIKNTRVIVIKLIPIDFRMIEYDTILAPSILAGDHCNLENSAEIIQSVGLKWLHLDIMDGHFVPNLTFGPQTLKALKSKFDFYYDVHLMLDEPQKYIKPFADAGANLISIHVEPDYSKTTTLSEIKKLGCQTGIVLNPDTSIDQIDPYYEHIDLVLLMTVEPGFGGQSFRQNVIPKIKHVYNIRKKNNYKFRIEVDGGINLETGALCKMAGCDTFVIGTSFFNSNNTLNFVEQVYNWH